MTTSTDTFWSVDGKPLQTYAFNIESWGGTREAPPALRGTNVTIPGSPGQVFLPKVVDSRVITLGMWVQGSTEDGFAPTSGDRRAEFEHNWHELRKLLWTPRRQITLTKRFRLYGSNTIITASAKAQYSGGLMPTMRGAQRATFTVDLFLADPYFYSEEITLPTLTSSNQTFEIIGDDRTRDIKLDITGARNNPKVTVQGPEGTSRWVKLTYPIGGSDTATIDIREFESQTVPAAGTAFSSSGRVSASIADDPFWLGLDPGTNRIKVESDSGAGAVVAKYTPVWL